MTHNKIEKQSGFTIVELLIVIVVIAILAAITIISFLGIQKKATEINLVSDLKNASTQLEIDRAKNELYPSLLTEANSGSGLNKSNSTTYQYTSDGTSFCLTATSDRYNAAAYYISNTQSNPTLGACPGHSSGSGNGSAPAGYETAPVTSGGSTEIGGYNGFQPANCPTNGGSWVKVPGNTLYGMTNGFCVQQYPASNVGGVAVSQQTGDRWTALTRTAAQSAASSVDQGTHLLTESEWMTIAANAAMQPANWSGGSVNNGRLPIGTSGASRGSFSVLLSNGSRVYFDTGASSYYAYVEYTCYNGSGASNCGLAAQNQPSPANAYYTDQLQSSVSSFGSLQNNGTYFYGDPRFANPSLNASVNTARNSGTGYLRSTYVAGSSTVYSSTRGFWNGANSSGLFTLQFLTVDSYAHATYGFRAAK